MEILASCSIEESKKYMGKVVLPCEDKKTPDKVVFNIVVNDGDTGVYKELQGNEKCVTFIGTPADFCPTELEGKVFNEYSLDDIENGRIVEVKGITSIVKLPDGYSNMRQLKAYNNKYPSVRFVGGYLLKVDGVNIGRYPEGREKFPPVYREMYDSFLEVNLSELDGLQEVIKRNKKKVEGDTKEKKKREPKEKKVSKRVQSFTSLFGGSGAEF